ncbi:transglutaminaseTgpA domain-containing protein [Agromyces albus]|uniref:Transglutaminase domain-containing protein n=1 Tax=Agromyces albus TaxID=205332 RepID=A0A4Q2KZT2_9MICO|nr:transglutaminase domain-containing protein [Agromyces albus]RXZ70120.1 transglutaminase domain-containing protein [Agromyces albus]
MTQTRSQAGADRFWATAVSTLLIAAMLAAALIPWWPIYESTAFIVAGAVAIVAGAGIGVAGARRRWPAWMVVVAVFAAYLVLGVPAAVPGRALAGIVPTPVGVADLLAAAALSWKQLVTIAVPVGSYQALLVPPFLSALVAATTAVTIALRSRRPAAAVVPPALLLVGGITFGVVHTAFAVEAGLAFLVAAVAWLVRVAISKRRAITSGRPVETALADARRVFGASALVAIALVGATAASLALPVPQRNVLRAELQPPFEPREHESPLAGFRAAFDPDSSERAMLGVRGLPEGAGIRIATLDTYDGIIYSVGGIDGTALSGRFTRLPYRLDQSGAVDVRIEVSVLGYADVWVPGVGRLERIAFGGPRAEQLAEGFVYNDVTGTGAVQEGLDSGDSYTAFSVTPADPGSLVGLRPGTSVLPPSPDLPAELAQLLDEWAPATGDPGRRLAQLIKGFHDEGYVSHGLVEERRSRSGHSLDRLAELATESPMVGDGEQYAVAAALMARRIGFPARVVVGYLPGAEPSETDATPPAESDVTVFESADLQAWIEVQTAEGDWLSIDPNPDVREIPERHPDQPTVVSRPQSALPPPAERTPVDDLDPDPDLSPDDQDDDAAAWLQVLLGVLGVTGIVVVVLALIASPFIAIIAAKLRRRRLRRGAATVVERIEGGWQEFADSASDFGYPIRPNATRAEQAATVGGLAPLVLASVVDRAVFAPDGPSDDDDRRVWESVDELQERLGAPRTRRERWRAAVSLTSLGGYAVTRRGARS